MARHDTIGRVAAAALLATLAACDPAPEIPEAALAAAVRVDADRIVANMTELGADAMEGRGTGSPGYDRAAAWLAGHFESAGLEPAGEDGTFFQQVPLLASTLVRDETSLSWLRGDETVVWEVGRDVVVSPDPFRLRSEITAPLVFVGYGVQASEQEYDDWDDLDVEGAIVVVFRGAPAGFPPATRAIHSDRALTRRLAVERGAVGVLWMLTPQAVDSQPWERRVRDGSREAMARLGPDGLPVDVHPELALEALLSDRTARTLLASAGLDLDAVVRDLDAGTPRGLELSGRLRVATASTHRRLESPNVIGRIAGSDPALSAEHVVVTAHLDHLGVGEPEDGDGVYNGTYDNASGIAIMLEIARSIAGGTTRPARSILFAAVTAEERGLLGSAHWVSHPTVPLEGVVANVNSDLVLMLHPQREVIPFGAAHSTLGEIVAAAAAREGVTLAPDPFPEETIFLRSDQLSFIRAGIPAVFLWSGIHDGRSRESGLATWREWMRDTYHSPRDDNEQVFDREAGATMARLKLTVIWATAERQARPEWHEDDALGRRFGPPPSSR